MVERVLELSEALAAVLAEAAQAVPPASAPVTLLEAEGRVLAAPVFAPRDLPPFDRSTRDGFAVLAADGSRPRRLLGTVRAGEAWPHEPLTTGEAVEIMTGAPMPAGADAVVMVEHTSVEGRLLRLSEGHTPQPGTNVVPQGAEARSGAAVLPAGRLIGAAEVAVAASCGLAQLPVFERPRVAIVATGDELVELGALPADQLSPAQIYNSNSHALAALVRTVDGAAWRLPIAADTREAIQASILASREANLLLLSGGVSMGKFDLVEQVLAELGAEFFFTGARIQPGKPIVFGRLPNGPWFFGLPGNPISTQVCFHLFVAPLLRALGGRTSIAPTFVEARLAEAVPGGARVSRLLPAELVTAWDKVTVRVLGWQGSGDLAANARGNCYCVLPAGTDSFATGDAVRVLLR